MCVVFKAAILTINLIKHNVAKSVTSGRVAKSVTSGRCVWGSDHLKRERERGIPTSQFISANEWMR